jgi:hypothetical protein
MLISIAEMPILPHFTSFYLIALPKCRSALPKCRSALPKCRSALPKCRSALLKY